MDNKKKILIIKLSSLGDVIFNIPLANVFKSNGYEVTWLVGEKGYDVIKNNPAVDNAILIPLEKLKKLTKDNFIDFIKEYIKTIKYLRSQKFGIAIDSQGLLKSAIYTAFCGAKRRITSISGRELSFFAGNEIIGKTRGDFHTHVIKSYYKFLKHVGLRTDEVKVTLPESTEEAQHNIDSLLNSIDKSKPIVAICPGTTWATKHWNKDNWKNLVNRIEERFTLIFTGTEKDKPLIEYISENKHLNLAGKTNIFDIIELFKRCDLLISLDSGSTHLAWATGVPKIVSIFCSTPSEMYAPMGPSDKYISIAGSLPCQPCHKKVCPMDESMENQCTLHPSVDDVLVAINKLMS